MYLYKDIKDVHLEITDKCNAACPQCARNDHGGAVNPRLPLVELGLADIKQIFPPDLVARLESVFACGNYGDAIMARDTLEIFDYFRSCNDSMDLTLHTNGSARRAEWWAALAKVISKGRGSVIWGIDGLADTNHIYRRNTKWSVIERNARAFITAGGKAHWMFIVFRHNEHQVEAARQLAMDMGFASFRVKKTKRFANYAKVSHEDRSPIKNAAGEIIDWLERPREPQWRNDEMGQFKWQNNTSMKSIKSRFKKVDNYLDSLEIDCKAASDKAIYVSAEGYVLPCCYLGTHIYNDRMRDEQRQILPLLEKVGGLDTINAKINSLKAILEGPFFQQLLPEAWGQPSIEAGKISTCARICGKICR